MKSIVKLFCFALLLSSFTLATKHLMKWKKIKTKEAASALIDQYIHTGDEIQTNYDFLNRERYDFIEMQGDTVIYYHSPYIPVHFGALVARKFMFTFHYQQKKLVNYEVEKALLGP